MPANSSRKTLIQYLKDINRRPLLGRSETLKVAKRVARGDHKAKTIMIESNLRFVVKVAKRYMNCGIPFEDLIQEGNLGLIEAVERFDYRKGCQFTTYAAFWIRQYIQRAVIKRSKLVRLPARKFEALNRYKRHAQQFRQINGYEPTHKDIAKAMRVPIGKVKDLEMLDDTVISVDETSNLDEDHVTIIHLATDRLPTDDFVEDQLKRGIQQALDTLNEKEREVILWRFGFKTGTKLSLRKTGEYIGMSQESVRIIEKNALRKLKRPKVMEQLRSFL